MSADNVVSLFLLVWTFVAVCQAFDDDFYSPSCDDVTGSVGEEVTFTCRVSRQRNDCCIAMYIFLYPEIYNDLQICKQKPPDGSCGQMNSFTCRYTPNTEMTGKFRFVLVTECGVKRAEFSVNITGPIKPEFDIEAPEFCSLSCADVSGSVGKEATLNCSVPLLCTECCITNYMFKYINNDVSAICKHVLPENSCEQRSSFTCHYTPTTAMTKKIIFFVQTKCGWKKTEFTVDTRETVIPLIDTETPGHGSEALVITGVSCFIIFIIIAVIAIIYVKRFKNNNSSGVQINYERGVCAEQPMMTTHN